MYILCYIYIYIIYDCYTVILWYSKNLQENPKACFVPFMFFFSHTRFGGDFPQQPAMLEPTGGKPNQYL